MKHNSHTAALHAKCQMKMMLKKKSHGIWTKHELRTDLIIIHSLLPQKVSFNQKMPSSENKFLS